MIYSVKDGGGILEIASNFNGSYLEEGEGAGKGAGYCDIYGRGVSSVNPYKHYNTPECYGGGCVQGDCTVRRAEAGMHAKQHESSGCFNGNATSGGHGHPYNFKGGF